MQWVASGFLFVRGNSFIHRLDPRVRLFLSGSLFLLSLIYRIEGLILIITVTILIIILARTAKRFAKSMVFAAGLSVFTFFLDFLLFPVHPDPLVSAATYAMRLFGVIASSSLFFLTTTPDELEQVLRWFHLPSDFVIIFVIAIRFVPVLILDALQIMDAQRSRGLEFEKGSILKKLRNMIPLLIPLIAVAVNRSLDLAEAMDSRAYGATKKPSSLYVLKLKRSDIMVGTIVALALALAVYGVYFLNFV